ncbi:glucose-1-phosphate cytidylyltransferase, partial [mine drainage metagenome]
GIHEFIICLGYKGYVIKEIFPNYFLHTSDVTFDIAANEMTVHRNSSEPWKVTLVDTGDGTMIGGRIKRIIPYVENDEFFCLTYGDGVGNIDITALINFHRSENRLCTITATQMPGRFGSIQCEGNRVTAFQEKPRGDGGWINGGFFVASPCVSEYIEGDDSVWEREPLGKLARENQLSVYFHKGFWQPMDTLRDKTYLEELWQSGQAPWKLW